MSTSDPAAQARERKREEIIGPALSLIHTKDCQLLPTRLDLLDRWKKDAVIAEVGVANGAFSEDIFKRCAPRELHLIDLWEGPRYEKGLRIVNRRLADAIASQTVTIKRGYSTAVLAEYPDHYFDVIYIDTAHSYELTFRELHCARSKVKTGGMIAGHDFCVGNVVAPYVFGVIQACCKFVQDEGWKFI